MLSFIVFVGLTIINSTEVKFEVIEKKGKQIILQEAQATGCHI